MYEGSGQRLKAARVHYNLPRRHSTRPASVSGFAAQAPVGLTWAQLSPHWQRKVRPKGAGKRASALGLGVELANLVEQALKHPAPHPWFADIQDN